jgi:hypothetical protein
MRAAVYATREQVKTALDSYETARNNARIDRHIAVASDSVEQLTLRKFYPMLATRTMDYPPEMSSASAYRVWLGENEMASAPTAITAGGTAISTAAVFPRPDTGPPYNELQVDLASGAYWQAGDTWQRALAFTSVYGYRLDESTVGDLAGAIDADDDTVTMTAAASAVLGVGSLIRVGTERINLTGRTMVTTGQTLQVSVDGQAKTVAIQVSTGSAYVVDETIMIDDEKMRVDEITGNRLTVKRAWDGSVLQSHSAGATIYAPRSFTLRRAVCGTTAISHSSGADVLRFDFPDTVNQFTIAYAVVGLLNESAGYARTVGAGDNQRESAGRQLEQLRKQLVRAYYRVRKAAV